MPGQIEPRRVAVALAIDYDENRADRALVMLVRSRKHSDKWVVPKGGIEKGESAREAAARELWEEAGVKVGKEAPPWGLDAEPVMHRDKRAHKKCPADLIDTPSMIPRAVYVLEEFRMHSSNVHDKWPEAHERERQLFPLHEAIEHVSWREGMRELIENARIVTSGFYKGT